MNRITRTAGRLVCFVLLAALLAPGARAASITTAGNGNWNSTTPSAPWPGGTIPSTNDTVIINHDVTLTDNREIAGITGTGVLTATGTPTLTVRFDGRTDTCGVNVGAGNALNLIKTGSLGTGILQLNNCQIHRTGGSVKISNGTLKVTVMSDLAPVTVVGNDGTAAKQSVFDPSGSTIKIGLLTLGDDTGYGVVKSSTADKILAWEWNVGTGVITVGDGNVISGDNNLTLMGVGQYNNPMTLNIGGTLDIQAKFDHQNCITKTGAGILTLSGENTALISEIVISAGTL